MGYGPPVVSPEVLEHLTRAQADAATRFARGVEGLTLASAQSALEKILGGKVEVDPVPLEIWPPGSALSRADSSLVAVVLGDELARSRYVVELDPVFAGFMVDRALGATTPEPRLWPGPATDGERGTLAYLAALAVRGAGPLRVIGVVTTLGAFAHALGGATDLLFAHAARLRLAGLDGWGRIWARPEHALGKGAVLDPSLELTLSLVGASGSLLARDVTALGVGDIVLPDAWSCRAEGGRWVGEIQARSFLGGPALVLAIGDEARVVRTEPGVPRIEVKNVTATGAHPMTELKADDVPVELIVEIARIAMTAGEISGLAPGAIVATSLPSSAPLILRVGTRVIGTGQIIDVDGHVGVRVISRS